MGFKKPFNPAHAIERGWDYDMKRYGIVLEDGGGHRIGYYVDPDVWRESFRNDQEIIGGEWDVPKESERIKGQRDELLEILEELLDPTELEIVTKDDFEEVIRESRRRAEWARAMIARVKGEGE